MKQETDYVRHSIQAKSSAASFTTASAALKQLSVSPIGVSFHNHDNLSISYRHIFHHPRSICLESFGLPPTPLPPSPPLQTNKWKETTKVLRDPWQEQSWANQHSIYLLLTSVLFQTYFVQRRNWMLVLLSLLYLYKLMFMLLFAGRFAVWLFDCGWGFGLCPCWPWLQWTHDVLLWHFQLSLTICTHTHLHSKGTLKAIHLYTHKIKPKPMNLQTKLFSQK